MANQTLIIHCGDFKCGSTTLQNAFSTHSNLLRKVGVDYTSVFRGKKQSHFFLMEQMKAIHRGEISKIEGMAELNSHILEAGFDVTFLSSEAFQNYSKKPLADFRRQLDASIDLKVLYYVRPHEAAFLSRYAQRAKLGRNVGNIAIFLQEAQRYSLFEYGDKYDRFAEIIGEKNLIFRPFDRTLLIGNDIVTDAVSQCMQFMPAKPDMDTIPNTLKTSKIKNVTPNRATISVMQSLGRKVRAITDEPWLEVPIISKAIVETMTMLDTKIAAEYSADRIGIPEPILGHFQEYYLEDARRMDNHIIGNDLFLRNLQSIRPGSDFEQDLEVLFSKETCTLLEATLIGQAKLIQALIRKES